MPAVSTGTSTRRPCRAYNRFRKDKAAMVVWDGSSRVVSKIEYDRAIKTPDRH